VVLVTLVFAFPLLWTLMTSFKPPSEYYRMPPAFFPERWTYFHYLEAFAPELIDRTQLADKYWVEEVGGKAQPVTPALRNSIIVTAGAVLGSLIIGTPCAYALSRFRFRGSKDLALWILSTRMMPPIVAVIPVFAMLNAARWIDTYHGLILPYIMMNLPFVVWMMKGFFDEVPRDIEEQGQVDGATLFQAFRHLTLPLSLGGVVATALFITFLTWNEFLFAVILTQREVQTLPVALSAFQQDRGILWGSMSATVIVASLPILAITFFLQKQLVKGLTVGALK